VTVDKGVLLVSLPPSASGTFAGGQGQEGSAERPEITQNRFLRSGLCRLLLGGRGRVQPTQKVVRIEANRAGDFQELDHIEAALAPLILRDEGLGTGELHRQFDLGEASRLPSLNQEETEAVVLRAEE
jgi:hypothetical protein